MGKYEKGNGSDVDNFEKNEKCGTRYMLLHKFIKSWGRVHEAQMLRARKAPISVRTNGECGLFRAQFMKHKCARALLVW